MNSIPNINESIALDLTIEQLEELKKSSIAAAQSARQGLYSINAKMAGTVDDVLRLHQQLWLAIERIQGVADLFVHVHPSEEMRTCAETCEQEVHRLATKISLDRKIYDTLKDLPVADLSQETSFSLKKILRDYRKAGVDRDPETRKKVMQLENDIMLLGQEFSRNIREDVRSIDIAPESLQGLPSDYVEAHSPNETGKVTITTNTPDFIPFLKYADDGSAREKLYLCFQNRGYPANKTVLQKILEKRHELATTLDYSSYAEYALQDKMVDKIADVEAFIRRVSDLAKSKSDADLGTLLEFKRSLHREANSVEEFEKSYLREKYQAKHLHFDSQQMRPYFEVERVKNGVFAIACDFFGLSIKRQPQALTWHEDVEVYSIAVNGQVVGRFFLDLYPREGKYKHAACFPMFSGIAGQQLPQAALVCNFPKPGKVSQPALMQFEQVTTFFHEFGHLLHHVLGGGQSWFNLSGIATEWDFVEVPSQLMEEWAYDAASLQLFAKHYQSGEAIPRAMVDKLREIEKFGLGLDVRQQMFYASLSLDYYRRAPDDLHIMDVLKKNQQSYSPFPYRTGTHFVYSFGHLFGYSALYYTYMWSKVIVKDFFREFLQGDDTIDPAMARKFRDRILAPGGSKPAKQLVQDFLGRDHDFEAYAGWLTDSGKH